MPGDRNTLLDASQPGLRDNINIGGQAGLATYVAAKLFGTTPLPPGMPDWLKDSIESQANFAQRLPGADAMTIGGAGGGPLDHRTERERRHDAEAESIEYLTVRLGQAERERQHEAQWLSETHAYAGQTLTGAQWREMKAWFGNAENVTAWEDAMITETGESRAEVRRTGGKMKRFYDLVDKDAKGTLTTAEKDEFTTIQNDAQVKRGIEVQQEVHALRAEHGLSQSSDNETHIDGSQHESSTTRSDAYADAGPSASGLAGVRSISLGYRDAALGAPVETSAALLKPRAAVAANTLQASPDNMFG